MLSLAGAEGRRARRLSAQQRVLVKLPIARSRTRPAAAARSQRLVPSISTVNTAGCPPISLTDVLCSSHRKQQQHRQGDLNRRTPSTTTRSRRQKKSERGPRSMYMIERKHRTWSKSCLRPPGTTSRAQGEPSHGGWGRKAYAREAGRAQAAAIGPTK